jgi:predicted transcriptional regulator
MSKESEENNSKFSITLKPELNKALDEETKRKDRKKNFIVNLALKLFLEKPEKERDKLYP